MKTKQHLFTTVLLIFFISCFTRLSGKTYTDMQNGFSIQVPADWTSTPFDVPRGSGISFTGPGKNIVVSIESVLPKPYATAESIARDYVMNHTGLISLTPLRAHSINGIKGLSARYLMRKNDKEYEITAFFTLANNRGYILTASAPKNTMEQRLWEIDNITSTFTLENELSVRRYRATHLNRKPVSRGFHFVNAFLTDSIPPDGRVREKSVFSPGQTIELIVQASGMTNNLLAVWKNETTETVLQKQALSVSNGNGVSVLPLSPPDGVLNEGRYSIFLYHGSRMLKRVPFSIVNRSANYNYRALIPENPRFTVETGQGLDLGTESIIDGGNPATDGIIVYKQCDVMPVLEGNFIVTDETFFSDKRYYRLPPTASNKVYRRAVPLNRVCIVPLGNGMYRKFMITGQNYDTKRCTQSLIITLDGRTGSKRLVYNN